MTNRRVASSAGSKDDNHKSEMFVTQTEEMGGIIMMGHYEDARLKPINHDNSNNNNSAHSAAQANAASAATNTNSDAATLRVPTIRHSCSNCFTTGHRRPECPRLPCKHCGVKGHQGIDCPAMDAVHEQRYQADLAKRRAKRKDK